MSVKKVKGGWKAFTKGGKALTNLAQSETGAKRTMRRHEEKRERRNAK